MSKILENNFDEYINTQIKLKQKKRTVYLQKKDHSNKYGILKTTSIDKREYAERTSWFLEIKIYTNK